MKKITIFMLWVTIFNLGISSDTTKSKKITIELLKKTLNKAKNKKKEKYPYIQAKFFIDAVLNNDQEIIDYFLNLGDFDVNGTEKPDATTTALWVAIEQRNVDMVEKLLSNGAHLFYKEKKSSLIHAVTRNNPEVVKCLLEHSKNDKAYLNATHISAENEKESAIDVAYRQHYWEIFTLLFMKNVQPYLQSTKEAVKRWKKHKDTYEKLPPTIKSLEKIIPKGKKELSTSFKEEVLCYIYTHPDDPNTLTKLLELAVNKWNEAVIEYIIEDYKIPIDTEFSTLGRRAIDIVIDINKVKRLYWLVEKGASLTRKDGYSYLLYAAENRSHECVLYLASKVPDFKKAFDEKNSHGKNILDIAYENEDWETFYFALSKGATAEFENSKAEITPLKKEFDTAVEDALKGNFTPPSYEKKRKEAFLDFLLLELCAKTTNDLNDTLIPIIEECIKEGANMNTITSLKDEYGISPIIFASINKNLTLLKQLINYGADPTQTYLSNDDDLKNLKKTLQSLEETLQKFEEKQPQLQQQTQQTKQEQQKQQQTKVINNTSQERLAFNTLLLIALPCCLLVGGFYYWWRMNTYPSYSTPGYSLNPLVATSLQGSLVNATTISLPKNRLVSL